MSEKVPIAGLAVVKIELIEQYKTRSNGENGSPKLEAKPK